MKANVPTTFTFILIDQTSSALTTKHCEKEHNWLPLKIKKSQLFKPNLLKTLAFLNASILGLKIKKKIPGS
jgi:hypothetical protein